MKNELFWITTSHQGYFESLSIKRGPAEKKDNNNNLYSTNEDDVITVYKAMKQSIYNSYLRNGSRPSWLTDDWVRDIRKSYK